MLVEHDVMQHRTALSHPARAEIIDLTGDDSNERIPRRQPRRAAKSGHKRYAVDRTDADAWELHDDWVRTRRKTKASPKRHGKAVQA